MINKHINLGEKNILKIDRTSDHGFFLKALDDESVLLPKAYVTQDMKIGDDIEVFVYSDSLDRPVATTEEPLGYKDQFIFTKVLDISKIGAFVDLGLQKDLFVPKKNQKTPFKKGESRIIRILKDVDTNRLYGDEKVGKYLLKNTRHLSVNQEVNILILAKTPLGYKVIVENSYEGLIFQNEIFQDISIGDKLKAFVKQVRPDGKLDISLRQIGKENSLEEDKEKILNLLKSNEGFLPYDSKTDPKIIQEVFGISKKAYKRALNELIVSNIISYEENGIKSNN